MIFRVNYFLKLNNSLIQGFDDVEYDYYDSDLDIPQQNQDLQGVPPTGGLGLGGGSPFPPRGGQSQGAGPPFPPRGGQGLGGGPTQRAAPPFSADFGETNAEVILFLHNSY